MLYTEIPEVAAELLSEDTMNNNYMTDLTKDSYFISNCNWQNTDGLA